MIQWTIIKLHLSENIKKVDILRILIIINVTTYYSNTQEWIVVIPSHFGLLLKMFTLGERLT